RANRYLRNLLQKPLHINTFLIKNEPNIRSELDSLYKSLFAKLNLLSKNRTLLKAVILKLLINGSPDLIDFLNTEFGFDLDEGEVETWSKSHIYGRPYLGAWVKYYLKENSELSFVNKVGQSSFYEELSK